MKKLHPLDIINYKRPPKINWRPANGLHLIINEMNHYAKIPFKNNEVHGKREFYNVFLRLFHMDFNKNGNFHGMKKKFKYV